jgi:ferredoxin-NADP reductase
MPPATIDQVHRATPRSLLLRVEVNPLLAFVAGQAVLVGSAGGTLKRPYSIAVGPNESYRTGRLELLVGIGDDGTPGPHLPQVEVGTRLEIEGPVGTFTYPADFDEPAVLFVAGGTGIAPLRSMLHEAFESDTPPRLSVLYSARTAEEFAFDDELATLASDGRIRYVRTATREAATSWPWGRGRITRAQLETVVDNAETRCFVCGPAALVHEVPRMLGEIGVPRRRIQVEEWAMPRVER